MLPDTSQITLRANHIQRAVQRLEHDISLAKACIHHLIARGHLPTHVDAGETDKPIVWIEPRPACAKLKREHDAAAYKIEGRNGFRIETWQCDLMGCRVQWLEMRIGGHHHG